jgi:hypothetical protein
MYPIVAMDGKDVRRYEHTEVSSAHEHASALRRYGWAVVVLKALADR